jgi:gluconolactonase
MGSRDPLARTRCAVFMAAWVAIASVTAAQPAEESTTVTDEVKIEKIAEGFGFPEGPVWHPDGYLLFSDIHAGQIIRVKPEGGTEPWLDAGHKTNGLLLSKDKRTIYACCHGHLEFLAIDAKTKEVKALAKDFEGQPFLHVNDVAEDAQGNVFFTDPSWAREAGNIQGVYCITPGGELRRAVALDRQPNGIVVSPDQKWVYVSRTGGVDVWRFRLAGGGKLEDGARWVQLEQGGNPDGMTIDSRGNLYVAQAGNGKVTVLSPDGKTLRQIKLFDSMATNCQFEGGNEKVLYVTGGGGNEGTRQGAVYRVTLP